MGNNLLTVDLGHSFTVHDIFLGDEHTCVSNPLGNIKCFGLSDLYLNLCRNKLVDVAQTVIICC